MILGASGFIGGSFYKELNSYYDTFGTYFTKKGFKSISVVLPPRSIYVLSGESRYEWRHGIKKVKGLRYSITLRKKTDFEKKQEYK